MISYASETFQLFWLSLFCFFIWRDDSSMDNFSILIYQLIDSAIDIGKLQNLISALTPPPSFFFFFLFLLQCLTDLLDWLIDWLIDWLVCVIDVWLTDWLIDWLIVFSHIYLILYVCTTWQVLYCTIDPWIQNSNKNSKRFHLRWHNIRICFLLDANDALISWCPFM